MGLYKHLIRPILFRFPSDFIHERTVQTGAFLGGYRAAGKVAGALYNYQHPSLEQNIAGLCFKNPVGLAAGFDKNGTLVPIIDSLGFGYTEVGSITANPSVGNPKPRSFRLHTDQSLINRMGLNNDGAQTVIKRLEKRPRTIPLGINIAKTHDPDIVGERALEDYRISYQLALPVADYITLNISCPNTREGKTFEDPASLDRLLTHLHIGKDKSSPPVLVKFSVDLDDAALHELVDVCLSHSIDGFVATNTSAKRHELKTPSSKIEQIGTGGLSGAAIRTKSTHIIRSIHDQTKGEKWIIGVGGIFSAADAIEKIKAGADLVQVYTALVYEGPALVKRINDGLVMYLREHNIDHLYQLRPGYSDVPAS
ncbi:MAG: quinone-dependent dihydroorotate dehydrogenase [Balneolaceae bacterium]